MRLSRVYLPQKLSPGATVSLNRDSAHYLGRVLRLKPGDQVNLFNSEDGEFSGELIEIGKQQGLVHVTVQVENEADPKLSIHLGLGLSRGERMDYAVQKSTELGVTSITPLVTDYCEVRLGKERQLNRQAHWQRVAISACEQCGRSKIPAVNLPQSLQHWLSNHPRGILLDVHADSQLAGQQIEDSINVVVGPEGGFSERELAVAQDCAYRIIRLGPRILRTETAPVAILSLLQFLYGDLG